MTFAIYALLQDDSPALSNESLAEDLRHYFRNEENFSLKFEQLPFAAGPSLALRWDTWLVRVSYEEGDAVHQDSLAIQARTGAQSACDLSTIRRRVRAVFGSDDAQQYTNQILYLLDYLNELQGAIIFDPQKNDFLN